MTCKEAKTRTHRVLDDGVADPALDEHLSACHECRLYGTDMRRLRMVLGELRNETESQTSPQGKPRILRSTRFVAHRRVLAAAASIALLIVAVRFLPKPNEVELPTAPTVPTILAESQEPPLGISLQGASAVNLLAVASPVSDANVQVYFLYPRLDAGSTRGEPQDRKQ